MSLEPRAAFGYLAAVLIPLVLALQWGSLSPVLQVVPATLFLLLIALIARFCGFRPALVFMVSSGLVLSLYVLRFEATEPSPLLLRIALYLAASITIASISRQRSEDVREAEERYRSLVELSPDGIGISDEDSNIVFANTALARLVGATDPTQIIGKKTLDFTHPDYLDTVQERIQELRSGQRVPIVAGKWIKLDGTSIDVETAGVPIRKRGKLFYQGFVRDITDRKKAEATLEESRRRLQAVFDTAIDTITLFDSEGHFIDANPAATALLGYSREELLQSKIGILSSQEDPAKTTRALRNVLTAGRESGEAVIRRKDGSTREIEYRAVGNVLPGLHFVMMHDITARKEAERSLQQLSARLLRLQDEERRRIARQLHDTTGQSLAALRLNLSRIGRSAATADPAAKDAVDESIALTEQSISEIRTLSYLLHPPLIDEAGLLPSLRWYVRGFQERSGIKVTFDAPEELDRLRPDFETAVFRIMQEALTNIQRHSGSAVARVRLEREPQSVRLQIEDEGRGMPGHLRGREEAMAAAGVGIAGIRERVRELGGRVEIQSEDRGTRIVVTLPLSGP